MKKNTIKICRIFLQDLVYLEPYTLYANSDSRTANGKTPRINMRLASILQEQVDVESV